jgi:ABC-type uncharacterized transport system permease subunit
LGYGFIVGSKVGENLFFRKFILFLGLNLTVMEDSNVAIHDSNTMDETTKKKWHESALLGDFY